MHVDNIEQNDDHGRPGLDLEEENNPQVNFQNSQRENAVLVQAEFESAVLEREDNEGEENLEANREVNFDVHEQETASDFNETSRETTGGILNLNHSVPELIENVSRLLEDDFQDNEVEQDLSTSTDLPDEIPSESDPTSKLNRKIIYSISISSKLLMGPME